MSSQQELQDSFQQLYDELTNAYWVASTIESKDMIRGAADACYDALTEIEEKELVAESAEYLSIQKQVQALTNKLVIIQGKIDDLIHNISTATQVTTAIAKALAMSAAFF